MSDRRLAQEPAIDDYAALFAQSGGTDEPYLRLHFPRYLATRRRFLTRWPQDRRGALLDVGAHWLHQSLLYALDGFAVTALDTPATFDDMHVRELARRHGIRLVADARLEAAEALRTLPDDSFDVVMFTEIIEHLTFNPVAMWREIHRVMKPGARIVVTTPNYYGMRRLLRAAWRFVRADGGSVSIHDLLQRPSFAHHWKEYAPRELERYFRTLSADFVISRVARVRKYGTSHIHPLIDWLLGGAEALLPPLRPNLHLEVELVHKEEGICVQPHW